MASQRVRRTKKRSGDEQIGPKRKKRLPSLPTELHHPGPNPRTHLLNMTCLGPGPGTDAILTIVICALGCTTARILFFSHPQPRCQYRESPRYQGQSPRWSEDRAPSLLPPTCVSSITTFGRDHGDLPEATASRESA